MKNNYSLTPLLSSSDSASYKYFLAVYQDLNSLLLTKPIAWEKWTTLLEWNKKNNLFPAQQLQKLWMKLIKKYKFKLTDWKKSNSLLNIHLFLLDDTGHGLQKLMRFYQNRKLSQWNFDAFEFGLNKLLIHNHYTHLEMFFLTQIICEEWAFEFQQAKEFHHYYQKPHSQKTKEIYEAFIGYMKQTESGKRLFGLLTVYNPNYNIAAKSTPKFYKELYQQLHVQKVEEA